MTLFTQAPIWVWPLFVLLLVVGLRALRPRDVPLIVVCLMPLLGLLGFRAVLALPAGAGVWLVFAVAYGLGALLGYRCQSRWLTAIENGRVRLQGEPMTLIMMMLIFMANFVNGFVRAVAPDVVTAGVYQSLFAAVVAIAAGSFMGRACKVWRFRAAR